MAVEQQSTTVLATPEALQQGTDNVRKAMEARGDGSHLHHQTLTEGVWVNVETGEQVPAEVGRSVLTV